MSFIADIAALAMTSTLVVTLAGFGAGALIERLAPAENAQPRAHLWMNIGYTAVFAAILYVMEPLGAAIGIAIVNACGASLVPLPRAAPALCLPPPDLTT